MRVAEITRKTKETDIYLKLDIDGSGKAEIKSGCAFLDHMLDLFAKHGKFDVTVKCKGDTDIDFHHTTEDIGICLGQAFNKALGDKAGITRFADTVLPMDEALVMSAVDVSGRSFCSVSLDVKTSKVGDFDTELVNEFFVALANNMNCTLHIRQLSGSNAHHVIEATYKSVARSLKQAVSIDKKYANEIPSTKGVL